MRPTAAIWEQHRQDFTDLLGLRQTEIDGLYDGETNQLVPEDRSIFANQISYESKYLCQLIDVTSARVLMTYGTDFFTRDSRL